MVRNQDKIHKDLFEDLEDSIAEYEQLLSRIEQSKKGLPDGDFIEKHSHIFSKMDTFTNDFKTFKRIVFDYVKGL